MPIFFQNSNVIFQVGVVCWFVLHIEGIEKGLLARVNLRHRVSLLC